MIKNKKKKQKPIINYPLPKVGTGVLFPCHICGRIVGAVYVSRIPTSKWYGKMVWWCDHGRCDPDNPDPAFIEQFERSLNIPDR
jgi:hypothetical protein